MALGPDMARWLSAIERVRVRRGLAALFAGLWVLSLLLPAMDIRFEGNESGAQQEAGWQMLLFGWLAVLGLQFGWLANLLLVVVLVRLWAGRPGRWARALAVALIVTTLDSATLIVWPEYNQVGSVHAGYWVWAAANLAAASALLVLREAAMASFDAAGPPSSTPERSTIARAAHPIASATPRRAFFSTLAALGLVSGPALARAKGQTSHIPAPYVGAWGKSRADCSQQDGYGPLDITPTGFSEYELVYQQVRVVEWTPAAIRLTFGYSETGTELIPGEATWSLSKDRNRLLVSDLGATLTTYVRCSKR